MKFSRLKIVLAIAFIILIISVLFIYNSKLASKKGGITEIAYWNFEDNMNKTVNSKISLAQTITNSKTKIAENCIAPGTEGKFNIVVNANGSKVKIDYEIKLIKELNTPNNLYFFIKENDNQKQFKNLTELFNEVDFTGSIEVDSNQIKVYEIFWNWPYENYNSDGTLNQNKEIDDLNFAKSNLDYIFEIEISGKQSLK